jgi:hypothetical protein
MNFRELNAYVAHVDTSQTAHKASSRIGQIRGESLGFLGEGMEHEYTRTRGGSDARTPGASSGCRASIPSGSRVRDVEV